MSHCARQVAAIVLAVACTPGTVKAEPITVVFDVLVTRVESFNFSTSPVGSSFALSLTFDPAQMASVMGGVWYGVPIFSAVPLSVPTAPEGIPLTNSADTFHGTSLAIARIRSFGDAIIDDHVTSYDRILSITGSGFLESGPIRADQFPSHLESIGNTGFNFEDFGCIGVDPIRGDRTCLPASGPGTQWVRYGGLATPQQTADPIPEPGTLALVAAGAWILHRRTRETASPKRSRGPNN